MQFSLTIQEINQLARKVHSQSKQDGVILGILNNLGSLTYKCVEFGAGDGKHLSNTLYLEENGWSRKLFDVEPGSNEVIKERITPDNINSIFGKHGVSYIDYLSIDCDGLDPYMFLELEIRPKLISVEYNSKFSCEESYIVERNNDHIWQGDDYYSASLLALKKIGEQKGYTLVYVVDNLDAFFVRNDLIAVSYVAPVVCELLPKPIKSFDTVSEKQWLKW